MRLKTNPDQLGADGAYARFRLVVERFTHLGKCVSPHSQEWHALVRKAPPDVRPEGVFEHPTIVKQRFEFLQDTERSEQRFHDEKYRYNQRYVTVKSDTNHFLSVLRLWIWTKLWGMMSV